MPSFIAALPLIFIAALALLGLLLKPPPRSLWIWTAFPALAGGLFDALLLTLLPVFRLSFGPVGPPLFFWTFARLGLLVPALVVLLLARKRRSKALPIFSGSLQALLSLVMLYGFYLEPFRLTVTNLPLPAPNFIAGRPLRILQLSDLHVERLTRREWDVLAEVDSLQPDIIVLTGDFVNLDYQSDPLAWQETRTFLAQLRAPYGLYAVTGTTDTPGMMSAAFAGLDIQVLEDETKTISFPGGDLSLLGVTNTVDWERDKQALSTLMAEVPPNAYSVLLYHTPDLIETASAAGVDLYLAGHTHGGQVRLPGYGAILTFSRYGKRYEMGEYSLADTTLYVSRGLGMEGWGAPRIRFLCPPEMVLVELGN